MQPFFMKKLTIATVLCTLFTTVSFAQPRKGDWMVGAGLAAANADITPNVNTNFNVSLFPKAGYFVGNRLAIGTGTGLSFSMHTSAKQYVLGYSISPFARWYFAEKEGIKPKKAYVFTELDLGYRGSTFIDKPNDRRYNSDLIQAGLGVGAAYFIVPNVSLEGLFKMNHRTGVRNAPANFNHFSPSISLGFQIYLRGRNKSKNTENE